MSLDECQSPNPPPRALSDTVEMVGVRTTNVGCFLPTNTPSSRYIPDLNEDEMIEETNPYRAVPVPVPIDTLAKAAGDPTGRDIVFFNRYILIRLLLALLTLLMLLLCLVYAIGQVTTLTIQDFICTNKPIAQIRHHSQEFNLPHGTTSGCWTSKGVKANQDLLFQNRAYQSTLSIESLQHIVMFSLFVCAALCLLFCLIWQIVLFIQDIIRFQTQKWLIMKDRNPEDHTTRSCCCRQKPIDGKEDRKPSRLCACCGGCCKKIKRMMPSRQFQEDRPGWIIKHFVIESCEIVLQTFALFQYAGVQLQLGKNDNLAEEYQYVWLFGIMIAMNAITVGFFWIFYVSWNQSCHGKSFHFSLLIVDSIFETFYAIFPLILVWDYTTNGGPMLGQIGTFHTESWLSFLRSFVPIALICVKMLTASSTVVFKSRTIWKHQGIKRRDSIDSDQPDIMTNTMGVKTLELQDKMNVLFDDDVANVQIFINKASCCKLCVDDRPLLDHDYSHTKVREMRNELSDA
eukprot:214153_1